MKKFSLAKDVSSDKFFVSVQSTKRNNLEVTKQKPAIWPQRARYFAAAIAMHSAERGGGYVSVGVGVAHQWGGGLAHQWVAHPWWGGGV